MSKHNAWKGTVAVLAATAAMFGVTGTANAADGKSVDQLAAHGGAQRIAAIGSERAKNVILFIGDGMGDSEITVARDYLHGFDGSFDGLDRIGQPGKLGDAAAGTGQYTTYSLGGSSDDSAMAKGRDGKLTGSTKAGVMTPVTDSSASGSGWATGTKTYNNAVDVDVHGNPQLNLIELAKAKGLATGNVTTAEIQDATPAVLESHSTERACYGPQGKWDGATDTNGDGKVDASDGDAAKNCLASQLKVNGGIGSISEQLLDTRADVTIGGGAKYFNQIDPTYGDGTKTLWQQAADRGFQTVDKDVDQFAGLAYQQDKPVLALMADGNMPTQFNPTPALTQEATEQRGPVSCTTNDKWLGTKNANGNSASLADMTDKAIDLLQANPKSRNGFFLQVEGASIDKQDHAANACGQIGETDDLDKAISAALKKVDLKDTLIIVTADHAHTSQIVNEPPAYALSTILVNKLGERMVVSYGTAPSADPDAADPTKGYGQGGMEHTGTQLRIAASGPGAQRVNGLTDQTDNFYTIAYALGLAADTDSQQRLSDGAKVEVAGKDGATVANATGFDGDAVLSYELKDDADGTVVASSDTSTPVSGVRVATAATTAIPLQQLTPGANYTLTVTGRQSGKQVTVPFTAAAQTSAGQSGQGDGVIASGTVNKPAAPGALGKTGATVALVVLAAAALAAAGIALRRQLAARR
ncbi:alkaline phosphatase [Bifidobacterium pullorum subsp. saeculare]|uniref:Alkaline phosphatase n=1 Tax=Bifidobacterium pullorum subsp. saeculare TaxID=78257 RepID=A0A939BA19_9BIFI|nr:alkaline phosphatase [Bifidobacterium pullorum]MBM6700069.1 alkaline phosphatase [Bifidobacterium pullorum subsp. saeculare]